MKRLWLPCLALLSSLVMPNALQAAPAAVVHFGTDATYPPLVMLTATRDVTGFETEMLKALCSNLQWECSFSHIEWDNLIPALNTGKIDAIYGGIAITSARKEQFLFTEPFLDESLWASLVKKHNIFLLQQKG